MKPEHTIVASGYNMRTDEQWYRFADGEVRCIDTVEGRRESTYLPPDATPAMIREYGRNPDTGAGDETV